MAAAEPEIPSGFSEIREGAARALFPGDKAAFYNKPQVQNRAFDELRRAEDVSQRERKKERWLERARKEAADTGKDPDSVVFEDRRDPLPDLRIFEAMSATGLRAVRYAKEIPQVGRVVANDLSDSAVDTIRYELFCYAVKRINRNIAFNGLEGVVEASHGNCTVVALQNRGGFDVIDLDPYGSAAPFLDSHIQAVADGGLMCITCTDLAVLCGNHPETAYGRYGATAVKAKNCHESALRILLATIERTAALHRRAITPLLSVYMDFYIRVFVRIHDAPGKARAAASHQSLVLQCPSCPAYTLQPMGRDHGSGRYLAATVVGQEKCLECGSSLQVTGPIFHGAIHDRAFVERVKEKLAHGELFRAKERVGGLLNAVLEEDGVQTLHYDLHAICNAMKSSSPPLAKLRAALRTQGGYRLTRCHVGPNAIKTDCPQHELFDIIRAWRLSCSESRAPKAGTLAYRLVEGKQPQLSENLSFEPTDEERERGEAMFYPNPEERWGPKARARIENGEFREMKRAKKDE